MLKQFLYKLKEDLKSLGKYPDVRLSDGFRVDYDKYWRKRRKGDIAVLSSWQRQRADHILRMIEEGSRVMDIGCGDGALLKYLIDKGGITGIGVDMSQPILEQTKALGIETHLIDLRDERSLTNLPEVDYILGLEILEHMPESEVLIMNLKLKARKGMIFSFPNTGYYLHRIRLLSGKFPLQWIVHPGEHLRYWTVSDVKWWIKSLGFVLDRTILYEGLPLLNKIFPSLFGQGIIIKIHERK
jgi:methionine biosynthesis protein MetW